MIINKKFLSKLAKQLFIVHCSLLICATAHAASVVSRAAPTPASRVSITARMPTMVAPPPVTTPDVVEEITETIVESIPVQNKSTQFDAAMGTGISDGTAANDELAENIRRQRLALDSSDAMKTAEGVRNLLEKNNANTCDTNLRNCMKKTCGNDFAKCAGDGDTVWGDKMNTCRRDANCTGREFELFVPQIKADRDANAQLASYQNVIDCGNRYNDCIFTRCGTMLNGCLSRASESAAIAACDAIARECKTADSGLAARAMQVFATLRVDAETQVKRDEARLYEMRNAMANTCRSIGGAFDERSLDCVMTVDFFAGDTLFASKKLYAGGTFDCTPDWFGVDVTTYLENAARLTRQQVGASSALMGAGLGTAVGMISSGAIGRALDTARAEKAVDDAQSNGNRKRWEDVRCPVADYIDESGRRDLEIKVCAIKDKIEDVESAMRDGGMVTTYGATKGILDSGVTTTHSSDAKLDSALKGEELIRGYKKELDELMP